MQHPVFLRPRASGTATWAAGRSRAKKANLPAPSLAAHDEVFCPHGLPTASAASRTFPGRSPEGADVAHPQLPPQERAMPSAARSMRSGMGCLNLLLRCTVPSISTRSGMTLYRHPPLMVPMVVTAASRGETLQRRLSPQTPALRS